MRRGTAYITFAGRSVWALLNTYHAVLREGRCLPDKVHIIAETPCMPGTAAATEGIGIISRRYGISPPVSVTSVPCGDFAGATGTVLDLARNRVAEGYEIALDITPGRKALIVSACLALADAGIAPAHIFYLGLQGGGPLPLPHPMIPLHLQTLHDLAGGA
ncbi:MAG: hypothetical protein PHP59_04450 [Methanofollis sp.]|uniref:hypothetical protein n=1 Tax=Methanofollis sp. TaxID=2052835 RepID=UPI0026225110|nr:hypothetical protein [Methanofollis sp.]MDD4254610.1 hypothetical protein [Methanofollis sp.]